MTPSITPSFSRLTLSSLALALVLSAGSAAFAQTAGQFNPAHPVDAAVCSCLDARVRKQADIMAQRRAVYEQLNQQVSEETAALNRDRPRVDVTDDAAVDAFRTRADELAVERSMMIDHALPDLTQAVEAYNRAVANVAQTCAGRMLAAPPPDAPPFICDVN